jgi:hypothetical protein
MRAWVGALGTLLGLSLAVACGSDDEGGKSAGTGGSGTGGGAPTGGATSAGGTTATGGAAGATGGSGTATGGTTGGQCVASEPTDGNSCSEPILGCSYLAGGAGGATAETQCSCFGSDWDCNTCPVTEPDPTDPLCDFSNIDAYCMYGTNQCRCLGMGEWDCDACPDLPGAGDDCTGYSRIRCLYEGWECQCPPGPGANWDCDPSCPTDAPSPGSTCAADNQTCYFAGDKICSCGDVGAGGGGSSLQWLCN